MENGAAVTIANNLERKNILYKRPGKPGEPETFAAMALSGDFAEIEREKKSVAENVRTADLVASGRLIETITLTAAQKIRYLLYPVAADNFTATINRITNEQEDFRIKAVVCFARNVDEQNKIHVLLSGAIRNERYRQLVFIDASANLLSREIFTRWVENSANEKYWRPKDSGQANQYKSNAADCLKEWYNSFESGAFVYYPATKTADERKGISCQGVDRITEELKDNVRKIFPYAFDDANITDTLFLATNLKKLAEAGALQEEFSMLKANLIKIVLGDAWQMSGKYWEIFPDMNISRLKLELDALIKSEIGKHVRISFDKIFSHLLERGFMPLNIYAFLTGFLLKEYAADPYRFSAGLDGNLGGAMTAAKLAECISESLKQATSSAKNLRPKFLEIMSPNQRQFMLFAAEIFGVTEDVSVEQSAQKLRGKLKNLGWPLWCYVEAADEEYENFLRLLAEIANSRQSVSVSALAEQAGQFLSDNPVAFHDLKNFLTAKNGCEIFSGFLENFEAGELFNLAREIGEEDVVGQCQRRVAAGDGIWLHDKETAEDDLRKLIVDWKIVAASKKFGITGKSLKGCVKSWAEFCRFQLKIPADKMGECYPPLKNFFATLKEAVERGDIPQGKREFFLCQIVEQAATIREALSDPQKILREKYSYQLSDLSDEEIKNLHSRLPSSSFTDSQGKYHKSIADFAKQLKGRQLKKKLTELWREVAGNDSPREWSKINRTPILAMVPPPEQEKAKKLFETIMATSPTEKDIQDAIDYLETRPEFFSALKDDRQIEAAFREIIIGEPDVLFDDTAEVRDELELKLSSEAYRWYPNSRTTELVKKFAENKYYSGGACEKLTEKVERMSAEEAKKLLLDLLDKNYEVGLKLLRET